MVYEEGAEEIHRLRGTLDRCLEALFEKDRLGYLGCFVQGFIHNANGPLQNMSLLAEMLLKGQELQEGLFRQYCSSDSDQWSSAVQKQQTRIQQLVQQIGNMAGMLRDFMVIHEIEHNSADIDLNLVLAKLASIFRSDLFFKHQVQLDLKLARNLPLVRIPGRNLIPALVHIIQNGLTAVKNSDDRWIGVETHLLEDKSVICLSVRDSGCGFSVDGNTEELFGLFESAWEENDQAQGGHLGFGLFAVRHLLDPYGVMVDLKRDGCETELCLHIPVRDV